MIEIHKNRIVCRHIFISDFFQIVVTDFNDHCPLLSLTEDVFITPQPLLQIPPLLTVNSSDLDSGVNGQFFFYVSLVHTER